MSWRNVLIQGLLLGCFALSATAESKPQLLTQERVARRCSDTSWSWRGNDQVEGLTLVLSSRRAGRRDWH